MKSILITATLLIGMISLGYSQDRKERERPKGPGQEHPIKSPEERAKLNADMMAKKLNLTDKQKDEVYALNLERAERMEKIRKSEMAFRKELMEKHKSAMMESEKKLNKILTDEQQKTYQEMKNQERGKTKRHAHPAVRSKVR